MWYFIRWTSDYTSKEEIAKHLTHYIISKEYSRRNKLHYHIVTNFDKTKEEVKAFMYSTFKHDAKGIPTLKIDIIGKEQSDLDKCSTYSVKDDDYIFSDYFKTKISTYVENSYSKDQTVAQQISSTIELFIEEAEYHPNWDKLWKEILLIKAKAKHEIFPAKITAIVLSAQIRFDPNLKNTLCDKYFIAY